MRLDEFLSSDLFSQIEGVSADSRAVKQGHVFAAMPGTKGHGANYIADALAHGAHVVLMAPDMALPDGVDPRHVTVIESDNPRHDFSLLASAFYRLQPEHIVAVTGTSGKTSTVSFAQQLWHLTGTLSCASLGTLGIRGPNMRKSGSLTTPDPEKLYADIADLTAAGITHLAMEASSHGLEQYRLDGLKIQAAAYTNLSRDHLDYHADMESYFLAKSRLFTDVLSAEGTAVICMDDPYGTRVLDMCRARGVKTITVGAQADDIRLVSRTPYAQGQKVSLSVFDQQYDVSIPLIGDFQVMNALCALGLVLATGTQTDDAVSALEKLRKVAGRLQPVTGHPKGAGVYVDYAHKPGALESILKTLRPHTKGRLICVFGCGGDRDQGKRAIMGEVAARLSDIVIVTDDNPRSEDPDVIRQHILEGVPEALNIGDRAEAIEKAMRMGESGDVIVIAGKGHEQGQIIGQTVLPFDDVVVCEQVIEDMTA